METEVEYVTKRKNFSWAVFLVVIGTVLLLNTTNIIGWGIWEYMVRYWPILIVIVGINLVLGNSIIAKILEIFFTLLLTLSIFLVSYIQYTQKEIPFVPRNVHDWILKGGSEVFNLSEKNMENTQTVSAEEYTDLIKREYDIDIGAASFTISESDTEDYLNISEEYPEIYAAPVLETEERNGVLEIDFTSANSKTFHFFSGESTYDFSIGQASIPSSFDINLGAGDGEITLEKLLVEDFIADVGAGELNVTLGKDSIPSGDFRFVIGAGKATLSIPKRVGYVLEYDLGVGSMTIEGENVSEFSSGRGKYTSDNYESSDIKVNIVANVGVGSFDIQSN